MDKLCQLPGTTSGHRDRTHDQTSAFTNSIEQWNLVSPRQSWMVRAASWFGSVILEGFALHGQALYPCALNLSEDRHAHAENARPPVDTPPSPRENPWSPPQGASPDIDIHAWLATAQPDRPRGARRWFHTAALWPRRRIAASKRRSRVRVVVWNDRSLHQCGIAPDETSLHPQWFDPPC